MEKVSNVMYEFPMMQQRYSAVPRHQQTMFLADPKHMYPKHVGSMTIRVFSAQSHKKKTHVLPMKKSKDSFFEYTADGEN